MKSLFITGISRGLGKATALLAARKGYRVVGSVRNEEDLIEVARWQQTLEDEGAPGTLQGTLLDLENLEHMPASTRQAIESADILINNAGVNLDLNQEEDANISILNMKPELLARSNQIHFEAPRQLMALAAPNMARRGWGRVVNVSSMRAKMDEVNGDLTMPAYRLSKLLTNGLTAFAAHEYRGAGILINSVCPGWCKTDMGGPQASDDPHLGAQKILDVAELGDDGPTGRMFIDGMVSSF